MMDNIQINKIQKCKVLYADRYSKDEQLLIRPLVQQNKNMNVVGG
jgi:hypothetical protein